MPLAVKKDEVQIKACTVEDIYALPEGKRAELIDGVMYAMATPGTKHQSYISELHYIVKHHIKSNGGDCKIFPAPFAVFLNNDDHNYVEPDISIICDPDKLDDKGCNGAPDWVIEVVSPSSKRMDYMIKTFKYRTAGVRLYWILDPEKNLVSIYDFEHDDYAEYSLTDGVAPTLYPELNIDFSTINI